MFKANSASDNICIAITASHTGCMESHRLIDAFKSKANAEEIISLLKEFFVTKDDDSMDGR